MKTVALDDLPARREELLGGLAQGESFAVTDAGQKIAVLTPPPGGVSERGTSVYDQIKDLIGTEDGPTDLSNKKKYLTDYGSDSSSPHPHRDGSESP